MCVEITVVWTIEAAEQIPFCLLWKRMVRRIRAVCEVCEDRNHQVLFALHRGGLHRAPSGGVEYHGSPRLLFSAL